MSEPLRLKVSDKGGVSVYGLGRFPSPLVARAAIDYTAALSFVRPSTPFVVIGGTRSRGQQRSAIASAAVPGKRWRGHIDYNRDRTDQTKCDK
jgi:hypothetical protein